MKTIYCISGLGADERAFSHLVMEGYNVICLPWLTPLSKETITGYATRMRQGITTENPVLMGLSFGGMMSIEIAKQLPVEKLILISSVKSRREMPWWMKLSGILKLNRVVPLRSFKITEPIQNYFIGVTNQEDRQMVADYRKNASQVYINWAVNEVLRWHNDKLPERLFHVHGDNDKIFPIQNLKPTHVIKGGGHLMIMNKAPEINTALKEILAS